jgi:outer membrane lipoprotein SlyB
MKKVSWLFAAMLLAGCAADGSNTNTVIGGAVGGATGAAVGDIIGGRSGAIIGGAVGGATGAAVGSQQDARRAPPPRYERRDRRDDGEDRHRHRHEREDD